MMGHTLTHSVHPVHSSVMWGRWVSGSNKGDGLVSRVIADHVTLATVDTHVLINQCHSLLLDIQLTPCSNTRQSTSNNILCSENALNHVCIQNFCQEKVCVVKKFCHMYTHCSVVSLNAAKT